MIIKEKNVDSFLMDRIFLGEGLFETIRVSQSSPCHAERHLQRLLKSAHQLGFAFKMTLESWHDLLSGHIKTHRLHNGGIKVILTGGQAPRGLTAKGTNHQLLVQTFHYETSQRFLRLMNASWKRDAKNPIYHFKSTNYLEAILARKEAVAAGMDDVLFYNTLNRATETTCANFFIIHDNKLLTPKLSDGVLAGVMRRCIIEFCSQHHIVCEEKHITWQDIQKAEGAFLSNALQGIQPVEVISEHHFNCKHPLLVDLSHHF